MALRTVQATRYGTPLREGGSLPAIVEADDQGMYVCKFRGAGQGTKALIAELVGGELARACGLPMPEIVFMELDPDMARTEPDPEIQHLIRASAGRNLAVDYLPGSVTFDPLVNGVDAELASAIVWFDGFISNVDRTARNTNMLMWHGKLWLIDHGAALYVHHMGGDFPTRSKDRFPRIKDHVLLPSATVLADADARFSTWITPALLADIVQLIPDDWLDDDIVFAGKDAHRTAYADYLWDRLQSPRHFVEAALHARTVDV